MHAFAQSTLLMDVAGCYLRGRLIHGQVGVQSALEVESVNEFLANKRRRCWRHGGPLQGRENGGRAELVAAVAGAAPRQHVSASLIVGAAGRGNIVVADFGTITTSGSSQEVSARPPPGPMIQRISPLSRQPCEHRRATRRPASHPQQRNAPHSTDGRPAPAARSPLGPLLASA